MSKIKGKNFNNMVVDDTTINEQLDLIAESVDDLSNKLDDLDPTEYSGYDATKTQTLKNVEGTLTWVDDEE